MVKFTLDYLLPNGTTTSVDIELNDRKDEKWTKIPLSGHIISNMPAGYVDRGMAFRGDKTLDPEKSLEDNQNAPYPEADAPTCIKIPVLSSTVKFNLGYLLPNGTTKNVDIELNSRDEKFTMIPLSWHISENLPAGYVDTGMASCGGKNWMSGRR